jgi:hypothetical protein
MKSPRVDLFVFADALGWAQVERRDFLADLLPFRAKCDTLLGYSCTCDPSILTGALPAEHGHFSFFVFDPERSPFKAARWLGWLPETLAGNHRVRNQVSRWWQKRLGYTGYFQLYSVPFRRLPWLDYTEKRDLYEPGGIIGGQETIFRQWERSGKPWTRSDWRQDDATNVARLLAELREGRIALSYLFTSRLDATMHAHGTTGPEVDAAFARFAGWMREIEATAREHYDEVRIHLFSDHGMADTWTLSRMMPEFEELGLRYGHDYAAVWDSTMVRFWFPHDHGSIRERVTQWLAARSEGRILTDDELRAQGCFFPDHRYGELWYLLEEGTLFAPSFMNQRRVTGMHGYHPSAPGSAACWLTNHQHYAPPARIEQIHRVMSTAATT